MPKTPHGGRRPGSGRKTDVPRPAVIYIRTTKEVAGWFEDRAQECGGRGKALEAMHELWRKLPDE